MSNILFRSVGESRNEMTAETNAPSEEKKGNSESFPERTWPPDHNEKEAHRNSKAQTIFS